MKTNFYLKVVMLLSAVNLMVCTYAQITGPQPENLLKQMQASPLLFMENKGQITDEKGNRQPEILFAANSGGAKVFITATGIHYQFTTTGYATVNDLNSSKTIPAYAQAREQKAVKQSSHRFTVQLQNANAHPSIRKEQRSNYTENYYGANSTNGITGVPGYQKIILENVYPGIDWILYSKGGFLEYDFLVHAGSDAAKIRLKIKDADNVSLTSSGELLMTTSLGEVKEKAPVSYAGEKEVASCFKKYTDGTIGFSVEPQPGKDLRIDPSVIWATYYGSSGNDFGTSCTTDASGNVYLAGRTTSTSGIAAGGFQNTYNGGTYSGDAFLVKFSSSGSRLWATYYGGAGEDVSRCCVADANGNVYLAGITTSTANMAANGFQNTHGDGGLYNDGFLVKFSSSGNRIWATYYGGADEDNAKSCAVDAGGNIYLTGYTTSADKISSNGFQNTYRGGFDGFLVKFAPDGNRLWATYYGDAGYDVGNGCTTDASGNVYLAGQANSTANIASGGFQNTHGDGGTQADAFLAKFSSNGNRLWATYYGGNNYDYGYNCTTDGSNVYLVGQTSSASGISFNGFQNSYSGNYADAYLAKFSSAGDRIWATYYGGNSYGAYSGFCVTDAAGNVFFGGHTTSTSNIAADGFQNTYGGGNSDAFLVKLNAGGSRLWASYYGGSGQDEANFCIIDANDNIYLAGSTLSANGIASGGFQNTYSGANDAFLVKINGSNNAMPVFTLCPGSAYTLTANLTGTVYQWQINTGSGFTNLSDNTNYTGSNTATLQLTNLPSVFYGYQYRSIINMSDTGQVYQLRFANTWTGTSNSAWENPANWSCGILPDGNTDVIINTGPVTLNSNGICRTLTARPGVSFTITTGNTLTITH